MRRDGFRGPQGGVRTSIFSLAALLVLASVAIIVLFRSLSPPEDAATRGSEGVVGAAQRASAPNGAEIRGTVTIATNLLAQVRDGWVLSIIARKGPGPPFAVKRVPTPHFPVPYRIGAEDVMLAGSPFEGEVRMSARVSRTGSAGPPRAGDLEGEHPVPVRVGAQDADIQISRQH
jgi:hypothetical protein